MRVGALMMPSLYPNALPRQMPPTPPDYYDFCLSVPRDVRQLPALQLSSHPTQSSNYELGGPEVREVMLQYSHYNLPTASHPVFPQENYRHGPSSYVVPSQGPSNSYRRVADAPLLLPIRVPDHSVDTYQHQVRPKQSSTLTQPQEEKVIGGVAAHLDYEMEDMVDFVSETAQGMYDIWESKICLADIDISRSVVVSKVPVHPEFRKFVSQMLSSTRLPSSTILLGLHYLATRMTLLSTERQNQQGNGSLHRMLTTALLLGSKFLDDNTFQNRSWSEVSNIPVTDLNEMELIWLTGIQWSMHVNPSDPKGFLLWHQQWQRYQMNKASKIGPLIQSLKHTHLDEGTMQNQRPFHQLFPSPSHDVRSYVERPMIKDNAQWPASRYDSWPPSRSQMDYSPPSAPETGPNTPEWYHTQNDLGFGGPLHPTYSASKIPAPLQNAPQLGYHTPYANQYNLYSHGSTCPCGYCLSHHERYLMAPGYGPQSVVG